MQRNTLTIVTLVCGLALLSGCQTPTVPTQPAYTTGEWPLGGVQTQPAIEVESATRFACAGVRCQLLGVRESADPAMRAKATEFAKRWFQRLGNDIAFYNDSNPLVAKDGTCIVWVRGMDCYLSCLNQELVRAGLVEIDVAPWHLYAFTQPAKSRDYLANWQQDLADAKASGERGEKPHVLFEWP